MENGDIRKEIEQILFEIRWIQKNINPPVNYFAVALVSIIASIVTVFLATL